MYPYAICIIVKERYFLLPSMPTRGHGLVLLVFWTLVFIVENLSFINMRHEDWWFNLNSNKDKIEMSIFALRYASCLFIFVLGLKAPGIVEEYTNLTNDENSVSLSLRITLFNLVLYYDAILPNPFSGSNEHF